MIEYKPSKGTIASTCVGTTKGSCNSNFNCCRPKIGKFTGSWKCYPNETAYFDINSAIECWAIKVAASAVSIVALISANL